MQHDKIRYEPEIRPKPVVEKAPPVVPHRSPQRRSPTVSRKPQARSSIRWQTPQADFSESLNFRGGSSGRTGYVLAFWNWLASMIDILVLISLSSFFLFAVSLIFQQSLPTVFLSASKNQPLLAVFLEVFLLMTWIYMIAMRAFMGATVGEWACDVRLGLNNENQKGRYILKVAARESIMVMTGIVVLPLISLLIAKDFIGNLLDLRLYSLK